MPSNGLWAGALSLVLIHAETGCQHSALNAARLLEQLSAADGVDDATRGLCERASDRLSREPDTALDCLDDKRAATSIGATQNAVDNHSQSHNNANHSRSPFKS